MIVSDLLLVPDAAAFVRDRNREKIERVAARRSGAKWDPAIDMITPERAARVAEALFPDEKSDGVDCFNETGREGQPCRVCAERWSEWRKRVDQVHKAMCDAF